MKSPLVLAVLISASALGSGLGCDVGVSSAGGDAGVEPDAAPLPQLLGVVTSPHLGDLSTTAVTSLAVDGLHTTAGEPIEIQVLVAPYDRATSWTTVATTTASASGGDVAGEPTHPFHAAFDPTPYWPRGGLLYLRVRDHATTLVGFFDNVDACLSGHPSWRARAEACGVAPDSGLVLVAVDGVPDEVAPSRFLDDKGSSTPTETQAYYAAIGAPATAADFAATYLVADTAHAAYYNAGDLGIGRDMRCGTFPSAAGTGVACAVANYGAFGGSASLGLAGAVAAAGGHAATPIATVAMVFTPPIDAPNSVQFIVYGPTGALAPQATLDTHGDNTSIPNNCLNCHASGGAYDPATHAVTGAHFLPFDPYAFDFATAEPYRRTDQEDALRQLNALTQRAAAPMAQLELVQGFYGGNLAATSVANAEYTPPGWSSPLDSHVYHQVVAPFCRSCHVSRGSAAVRDPVDFSQATSFKAHAARIAQLVCGGDDGLLHRMPDAQATQAAFWRSRARAYLAAAIDVHGACAPR